jgi:hypothetical protein
MMAEVRLQVGNSDLVHDLIMVITSHMVKAAFELVPERVAIARFGLRAAP